MTQTNGTASASATNGNGNATTTYQAQPLQPGIYAPLVTPFDADEELDFVAWKTHVLRIARAGVGLVVMGTNGEAIHLSSDERYQLVASARSYLVQAGLPTHPIIAGTGVASVKETIANCKAAARAGADAAIVILPGYFAGAIGKDRAAIKQFFHATADASPIPIMLYNFPACVAGIDMDSDLLIDISRHPNVCGAKLTCAQIGKGARVVDAFSTSTSTQAEESVDNKPNFHVWTGFADILLPSMLVGMTGSICGTSNVAPRTTLRLFHLVQQAIKTQDWSVLAEAQALSSIVSKADWTLFKAGIAGTKWALNHYYYNTGVPRRPLQPASLETQQMITKDLEQIMRLERQLEVEAGVTPANP
ncbi:aldolase [Testicularia cyperi]|uniref:Aldolase n=1 Tax=Testicularia cyperi TaxID=1882483 RepID=A0A317XIC4_9BASI|nr:aldolase [Testicularia cyperi]